MGLTEDDRQHRALTPGLIACALHAVPASVDIYQRVDVVQNLRAGARQLHDLLVQFSNNVEIALAAHQAGADTTIAHGGRSLPYPQTMRYVPTIVRNYVR